jgi:hypothetical protein
MTRMPRTTIVLGPNVAYEVNMERECVGSTERAQTQIRFCGNNNVLFIIFAEGV